MITDIDRVVVKQLRDSARCIRQNASYADTNRQMLEEYEHANALDRRADDIERGIDCLDGGVL
jgi:hypothetical protein